MASCQPTVLPIHWRLAKGGLLSGCQPYFSPPVLAFLGQSQRTREPRIALGLGCIGYTLWLPVSEAATIALRDLQGSGMAPFIATKVGGPSEEKRPLGRWAAIRAACLLQMVDELADPAQPFADRRAQGLEGSITDMLRVSRWSKLWWHAFRGGVCAACYHRGPHLRFLTWWGRWPRLQTALEYDTRYSDPEIVGPLLLPVADARDFFWLCGGGSSRGPVARGHVRQVDGRHQRFGQSVGHPACGRQMCTTAGPDAEDGESSGSDSSTSSSKSSASSLESARSDNAAAKRDAGKCTVETNSGKHAVSTFVVGV